MFATMNNRTHLRFIPSPISLLLLAVYAVSVCSILFCTEAFASQEQATNTNPQIVVSPISTEEWRTYLGDIIHTKLSKTEGINKLKEMTIESNDQATNAMNNYKPGSSYEEVFNLAIRGISLRQYLIDLDRVNQTGDWEKQKQFAETSRAKLSKIIGSIVFDKSFANLTEVLEGSGSNVFLKKKEPELAASPKVDGKNSIITYVWADKKGVQTTDDVSKLPAKFRDKYKKTSGLSASINDSDGLTETYFWEDKKGIHTTDDVSKLPAKFRDKYLIFLKQNTDKNAKVEMVADKPIPESARNAFKALKKFEARCQAGISRRDYFPFLGETKFEVNMFVQSKESKDFENLKSSIEKTMNHYDAAGLIIREVSGQAGWTMAQGSISEASKELANAFELITK